MDAGAPALLVAQAIGRIGNYFNQELFGGPTHAAVGAPDRPAHRPAGYLQYATFQPTFLYEMILNLALAAFLSGSGRTRIRAAGSLRPLRRGLQRVSHLRGDAANRPLALPLGLRINFYVAALLTLVGAVWFVYTQRPRPGAEPAGAG